MTTEHGKPAKSTTIIVNGQPKEVADKETSFEQLADLAFDGNPPTGANVVITIVYSRGPNDKPQGSLLPGQSVRVKKDMVFNVTATDKS